MSVNHKTKLISHTANVEFGERIIQFIKVYAPGHEGFFFPDLLAFRD